MAALKQLARQTATYGVSSILGRFFNYLLVPIYTRVFDIGEYGVVTQLYAYVAFLNFLFLYGMDTAFFRYFQTKNGDPKVYSTSMLSVFFTSIVLCITIVVFSSPIASAIGEGDGRLLPQYVSWFACILALDAITAIPFAKLRQENRAGRFVFIRMSWIVINVALNFFFLLVCPWLIAKGYSVFEAIYHREFGIGYIFLSNLIASGVTLLMLIPEIFKVKINFDRLLWKEMLLFGLPLMVAGFAGMINETFDRILLPMLIEDKADAIAQNGIYGACYKLSIVMTLFIQTFRYAAEPFFFNHASKENPQKTYADVTHWFVIVCSFIFLGVMLYIDIVKLMIGEQFRSGLKVVPILLLANLCIGVYYNLSIWYKLTGKTRWGAYMSVFGAVVTLAFNFLLIPRMGYLGAAWTTLICYASMMVVCYLIGQRLYPVPYEVGRFFLYIILALALWQLGELLRNMAGLNGILLYVVNTIILFVYPLLVLVLERGKISYLRRVK